MTYKCSTCGQEFDDGDEYAEHVATHEDATIGVAVADALIIKDAFGG